MAAPLLDHARSEERRAGVIDGDPADPRTRQTHPDGPTTHRWRHARRTSARRTVATATVMALAVVVAACAPAPPTNSTVADPDPSETVARTWGSELVASERDVAYADDAPGCPLAADQQWCGGSQTLDIYPGRHGGSRGTIVVVHGGGFTAGDKTLLSSVAPLRHQLDRGWNLVAVNYRLADPANGRHLFPTALHDVAAAIHWIRANADDHGIDASRIVVAGESAGATIAALIGTAWNSGRWDIPSAGRLDGVVSIAGVLDPEAGPKSRFYLSIWATPALVPSATPASFLDPDDPPMWLIHGDMDSVVEPAGTSRLRDAALRVGAGPNVHLDVVDRFRDGSPIPDEDRNHLPAAGVNTAALGAWLDQL